MFSNRPGGCGREVNAVETPWLRHEYIVPVFQGYRLAGTDAVLYGTMVGFKPLGHGEWNLIYRHPEASHGRGDLWVRCGGWEYFRHG